jgi:hypothetical protein
MTPYPLAKARLDWSSRSELERRMRSPVFRRLSESLAQALVEKSLGRLVQAAGGVGAGTADLLFAARCHGVAAHLVAIERSAPGVLPAPIVDALCAEAARIANRGQRLDDTLRRLGHGARRARLPFVPLKGSFLRSERYPSVALRPSADIDLLIDRADLERWRAVLHDQGHVSEQTTGRHLIFQRPDEAPASAEGDHPEHPLPIELHDRLRESVLGRSIDITAAYLADLHDGHILGDVPARVPGSVAMALHLFLHAAPAMLDRGLRIAQLLDLQFVDDSPPIIAALQSSLGETAWAVAALADRDAPGLLSPRVSAGLSSVAPGAVRRRIILSRPGLLQGDPRRVTTLAGELLLSRSPLSVARRVRSAWRDRVAVLPGVPSAGLTPYLDVLRTFVRAAARRQ